MTGTQLYYEIQNLTPEQKQKVEDFILLLKSKATDATPFKKRQFGVAKGFFVMREDFDEPLDDFKEYM